MEGVEASAAPTKASGPRRMQMGAVRYTMLEHEAATGVATLLDRSIVLCVCVLLATQHGCDKEVFGHLRITQSSPCLPQRRGSTRPEGGMSPRQKQKESGGSLAVQVVVQGAVRHTIRAQVNLGRVRALVRHTLRDLPRRDASCLRVQNQLIPGIATIRERAMEAMRGSQPRQSFGRNSMWQWSVLTPTCAACRGHTLLDASARSKVKSPELRPRSPDSPRCPLLMSGISPRTDLRNTTPLRLCWAVPSCGAFHPR